MTDAVLSKVIEHRHFVRAQTLQIKLQGFCLMPQSTENAKKVARSIEND